MRAVIGAAVCCFLILGVYARAAYVATSDQTDRDKHLSVWPWGFLGLVLMLVQGVFKWAGHSELWMATLTLWYGIVSLVLVGTSVIIAFRRGTHRSMRLAFGLAALVFGIEACASFVL